MALVATAMAVACVVRGGALAGEGVWVAAVGAIALVGLFPYAFYRTWGGAWPRIGFAGSLMFLVGAAWAGVDRVPRWVRFAIGGVAVSMIPGAMISIDDLPDTAWLYVPVYVGGFIAVALVVGALVASVRPAQVASVDLASRPSTLRMLVAGIVGVAGIAAAIVGGTLLMSAMLSCDYGPDGVG